jgi:multiple sugar transport system permease protein
MTLVARQQSPAGATPLPARAGTSRERAEARWFLMLTLPWLLGFVLLSLLPLCIGFFISLTNYNGVSPDLARFVGFRNYSRAFSDPNVVAAARRTVAFVMMYVPLNFLIALMLALLVNAGPRARGVFRSLFYLPSVVPLVGAAYIWRAMLNRDTGLFNSVLSAINPDWAPAWLSEYATQSMTSMAIWLGLGFSMVLYIAALQNVPFELEQAARVDGASYLQRLRHVVLPLISPVIFYQVLISLIFALGVTIEPILLGTTSPQLGSQIIPNDNVLLTVYVYQQMFANQRFGYASALLWITFAASVLVTLWCSAHAGSGSTARRGTSDDRYRHAAHQHTPVDAPLVRDRARRPPSQGKPVLWVLLSVLAVVVLVPLMVLVVGTFAPSNQQWWPLAFTLEQYRVALERVELLRYAKNSLVLGVVYTLPVVVSSLGAGYAFARLRTRYSQLMFSVVVATMLVPVFVYLIPLFIMYSRAGLTNTVVPWLLWGLAGNPFYIFLFRQFFDSFPRELEEAAELDGLSRFGILWRIVVPNSYSIIAT